MEIDDTQLGTISRKATLNSGNWELTGTTPEWGSQYWRMSDTYPKLRLTYGFPATFVSHKDLGDQPEIHMTMSTNTSIDRVGTRVIELTTLLKYRRGTPDIYLSIAPTYVALDCSVDKECQTEFNTRLTSSYSQLATELRLELDKGIKIKEKNTGLEWTEGTYVVRYNEQVNTSAFLVKIDDQTTGRKSYTIRGVASYL